MKIEKYFSEKLRKYPKIRNNIKLFYQRINYIFSSLPKKTLNNDFNIYIESVGNIDNENFFGYYDKSPWDKNNKKILTLKVPFSHKHPIHGEEAIIGYSNGQNNFNKITTTKTWNLQQGCMLQWLGPDFKEKIIYNDLYKNKYVSKIYNLKNKNTKIIDFPIYTINKKGTYALSINFSRLNRLRKGYGYNNLKDLTKGIKHPDNDGIWLLDIENNNKKLIISFNDIFIFENNEKMENSEHRFNHLDFNPSGNRFSFIHRWTYNNETHSRLLTADINGENIYCLSDNKMVSHTCWKNNNQLLAWARNENNKDQYQLFEDRTENKKIIGKNILNEDGHPSYSPDRRYILTDTYPDRKRFRKLIIYDTKTKEKYILGKFFASFKYINENRCDLHPRWSRDGKYISFDSVHKKKRKQYIIKNPLI